MNIRNVLLKYTKNFTVTPNYTKKQWTIIFSKHHIMIITKDKIYYLPNKNKYREIINKEIIFKNFEIQLKGGEVNAINF